MRTIKLTLEYDGTRFAGWQAQGSEPGAPRTVQTAVAAAVESMTGSAIRLRGASRTDSGVHARGQIAAFDTENETIPLIGFERGITTLVGRDLVVRRAESVAPGWRPRTEVRGKHYRYTFWNDRVPTALHRSRVWSVPQALDLEAMEAGAKLFLGAHNFDAFRASGCSARHAHRTIYRAEVSRGPDAFVYFDVWGNAFVRNMVRIMTGTLAEIGMKKRPPESVAALLEERDRTKAGVTAPPQGLCLEEVVYDDRLPPKPVDDVDVDSTR